jgi:protein-S-isoprenylcysteine O-methyltransferase Ste14
MTAMDFSRGELFKLVLSRFFMALAVLMAVFFLPAWSFGYWQAWVYLLTLFIPLIIFIGTLYNRHPDLLIRRMRFREKEEQQKTIVKLAYIPFLLAFLLPGFDVRLGWSNVPGGLSIAADLVVLLCYCLVFLVFRENRFASRIVEVEKEQTVISSGPYAVVRHPMYTGSALMYIFTPLALGSYWAIIPAVLIVPVLVARILNEEEVLSKDLKGYPEYKQKVRFRLIPGIW